MQNDFHLVVTYPESFPQNIIDEEITEIKTSDIKIHIVKKENDIFAAMEWMVPTFFATYLLKPYFESFLKEAGKDHYEIVKNVCKKMLEKGKSNPAKLISASQSTEKLSKNYSQSISVSILFQTKSNRQIKLLFDNNLELSDWENALDNFSEYILEHYQNFPNDQLSDKIKDLSQKEYYVIYVKINPTTKQLEFHDDHTLIKESKA